MYLFTVRHGESEWNVRRKICGMVDVSLTEKGWEQAREAARILKEHQPENQIRHILVSPMLRARQTASCIEEALSLTAVLEPRIHEIDFGDLEGVGYDDPRYLERKADPFSRFPGGESLVDVAARLYQVIDTLPERFHGENVLWVCHGMMSKLTATYFRSYSFQEFQSIRIHNCQIVRYDMADGRKSHCHIKDPAQFG